MKEKLKSFLYDDTTFYTALLLLVAIVSFGLGRQSILEQSSQQINNPVTLDEIVPLVPNRGVLTAETAIAGVVVASKSGTKYHLPTCPGAKQIKESNIIEFSSVQAAEAAGYTAAANCRF
jgi:hypothetical protein